MNRLIDMACSHCGHVEIDVWVSRLDAVLNCHICGGEAKRAWAFVKAPGMTPQGTRPEVNTDVVRPRLVDTKAIAAETKLEVEQKWLRYSDERVAEQHISREINEAAGISDAAGNEKSLPTPPPITFPKPPEAALTA